jgi:hypothetical protein
MPKTAPPPPDTELVTADHSPPPAAAAETVPELGTEELAQLAYAAYSSKIVNDGGLALPVWAGLTDFVKEGWRAAAVAVSAVS